MSYSRVKTFNAGKSRTGLATVAWSLDGGATWHTTGVTEAPAGSGIYKATITFTDGFTGTLSWTTGDASPRYAAEEINPADAEGASVLAAPIGGGTVQAALQAMSAVLAGKVIQSADGVTNTFGDFLDPNTSRVVSTSTLTERDVMVN